MKRLLNFLFDLFGLVFGVIPIAVFNFLGAVIGWIWFDVLRLRRRVIIDNIEKSFPEWDSDKVEKVGRRSLSVLGRSIVDVFRLPFLNANNIEREFTFEGRDIADEALKKGKGVLCLGLHLGSGDLSISSLNYCGYPVNLISKSFKSKWLNQFWYWARQKHGTRILSDEGSSFDIIRALKRNQIVIFVLDQFMGPPIGVRTRFFGRETGTAMGLAVLAVRTGAPVLPCYSYISPKGNVVNVFDKEIEIQDFGSREATIAGMTQIYTEKIEEIVRKYPEQWMWVHRRWKEFKD